MDELFTSKPRVSIIVPTHNRRETLLTSLKSLLRQTYPHLEIYVADNASTDGTSEMLTELSAHDKRIRYMRRPENVGIAANYNGAFSETTGGLVCWLNPGYTFEPTKIEKQVDYLCVNQKAGLVHTGYYHIDDTGRRLHRTPPLPCGDVLEEILHGTQIHFGTILFRREVLQRIGLLNPHLRVAFDLDLLMRCALQGILFGCVQEPLTSLRLHKGSLSHNNAVGEEHDYRLIYESAFRHPNMPARLLANRERILANVRWWIIVGYYRCRQWDEANSRVLEEMKLTRNPDAVLTMLRNRLPDVLNDWRTHEPATIMEELVKHLPTEFGFTSADHARLLGLGYIVAAMRLYLLGEGVDAHKSMLKATAAWPEIVHAKHEFMRVLCEHAMQSMNDSPITFIHTVMSDLPESARPLLHLKREIIARVCLASAFNSYKAKEYRTVQAQVLSALRLRPSLLLNRGVMSILIKSLPKALSRSIA